MAATRRVALSLLLACHCTPQHPAGPDAASPSPSSAASPPAVPVSSRTLESPDPCETDADCTSTDRIDCCGCDLSPARPVSVAHKSQQTPCGLVHCGRRTPGSDPCPALPPTVVHPFCSVSRRCAISF
jgi:hypothetical protein